MSWDKLKAKKDYVFHQYDGEKNAAALTQIPTTGSSTAGTQYRGIYNDLSNYWGNKQAQKEGGAGTYVSPVVAVPTRNTTQRPDNDARKKTTTYTTYTNTKNQPYIDQLNALYDQIVNRKPFQYDLNGDLLYRQMADRYTQLGQQASMDAMGQAAMLTGGYGNSYAAQVGNQANQQYLTALNDAIPDLYQQAYNVWSGENDRMLQLYQMAAQHPGILNELAPKSYTRMVTTEEPTEKETTDPGALTHLVTALPSAYSNMLKNWYYTLDEQKKE